MAIFTKGDAEMFYILNNKGEPLMPTTRYRHIKKLIREGKAVKISSYPFVVKLLYKTPNETEPLTCGIDPGRTNIGIAVVKEDGTPVFEAELVTRNKEVPKGMKVRKGFRQQHRSYKRRKKRIRRAVAAGTTTPKPCKTQKAVNNTKTVGVIERMLPGYEKPVKCIGIRNKEARFNNRKRPDGWLTPTANHLLQTHINVVRKIQKFLPITNIVLEVNKFAFMEMDNPHIQKWQYQKGPLYGKGSVHDAVYEQQEGHCIFCNAAIDNYHHVIPRSKGGSDTLPNIAGLCDMHHDLVHKDAKVKEALAKKKAGLNKKYGALSVLNQIIPKLVDEYAAMLPTTVTDGRSTKAFRDANGISKTHYLDAYCIACSVLPGSSVKPSGKVFHMQQFRRHDRQACHQERVNRKYMLNGKVVAKNRSKAKEQFDDSLKEYIAAGGRTDILTVKKHPPAMKHMDRIMPGTVLLVDSVPKVMVASHGRAKNGMPLYYQFSDGTQATPKHCKLVKQNAGIVFV